MRRGREVGSVLVAALVAATTAPIAHARSGPPAPPVTAAQPADAAAARASAAGRPANTAGPLAADAAAAALPRIRTILLGHGVTMELVLVGPGRFEMGSYPDVGDGDEKPRHAVTLSHAYYIGKFEVTQRQWEAVLGDSPSHARGADLPVDSVSWDDCQRFLAAASARTGFTLRLPTEAEWECACRAGTDTRWPSGDDDGRVRDYGWVDSNANDTTHRVGVKKPNAWGLYDVMGNVAEWCADWYANPYPADEAVDPAGPGTGAARVVRGGNFNDSTSSVRSAARNCLAPTLRNPGTGLRCVVDVTPALQTPAAASDRQR